MEPIETLENTLSTPQVVSLDDDILKLDSTWNLVLPTYFDKCVELSKEKGSGITIFKMLSQVRMNDLPTVEGDGPVVEGEEPSKEPTCFNCEVHYFSATDRSFNWDLVLETAPNRTELLASYDPENHILVSVHVPVGDSDDTIGNVRLFQNVLVGGQLAEVVC